jgi:hypothetical protein
MKHYIGLDVSMKRTFICVINEQGKIVRFIILTDLRSIEPRELSRSPEPILKSRSV